MHQADFVQSLSSILGWKLNIIYPKLSPSLSYMHDTVIVPLCSKFFCKIWVVSALLSFYLSIAEPYNGKWSCPFASRWFNHNSCISPFQNCDSHCCIWPTAPSFGKKGGGGLRGSVRINSKPWLGYFTLIRGNTIKRLLCLVSSFIFSRSVLTRPSTEMCHDFICSVFLLSTFLIDPSTASAIWPVTHNHQLEAFLRYTLAYNFFLLSSLRASQAEANLPSLSPPCVSSSSSQPYAAITANIVLCMWEDWLYTRVGLLSAWCV